MNHCMKALSLFALGMSSLALGQSEATEPAERARLRDVLSSRGTWVGKAKEKCFPHEWKNGDPTRFAVAVNSELCLRGIFGKEIPLADMRTEIAAQR